MHLMVHVKPPSDLQHLSSYWLTHFSLLSWFHAQSSAFLVRHARILPSQTQSRVHLHSFTKGLSGHACMDTPETHLTSVFLAIAGVPQLLSPDCKARTMWLKLPSFAVWWRSNKGTLTPASTPHLLILAIQIVSLLVTKYWESVFLKPPQCGRLRASGDRAIRMLPRTVVMEGLASRLDGCFHTLTLLLAKGPHLWAAHKAVSSKLDDLTEKQNLTVKVSH